MKRKPAVQVQVDVERDVEEVALQSHKERPVRY
jgi:hypothetical protein